MAQVFNKSKQRLEPAKKLTCPMCQSFGSRVTDKGEPCPLCKGHGKVMMSRSGWLRRLYARQNTSELF